MSYRYRDEDFPPLQREYPSTLPPPDQGHWQATPQALPPRRVQRQQGPVYTPHTHRKDLVTSSSAPCKPRKMVLDRQDLQAKVSIWHVEMTFLLLCVIPNWWL